VFFRVWQESHIVYASILTDNIHPNGSAHNMGFLPDPEKHTFVTYSLVIATQPKTIVIAEQPRTILSLPDDGYVLSET
jgi:hypothetical protein